MKLFKDENAETIRTEIAKTIAELCSDIRRNGEADDNLKRTEAIARLISAYKKTLFM